MSEFDNEISRRDFLKLTGIAIVATSLPETLLKLDNKLISRLESVPTDIPMTTTSETESMSVETEPQTGIQIIDNTEIKRRNETINIHVDTALAQASILNRARQMISPEHYPQVEEMINKLVISFGSRDYTEVVETAINRQNSKESQKNNSLKAWLISRINAILSAGIEPGGFCLADIEHPLIYINTGQLKSEEELKLVWDHETAHLIYLADPDKKESFMENVLEKTAIATAIDSLASTATTFTAYGILAKQKNVDIKTLINKNKEEFVKNLRNTFSAMIAPSIMGASAIHYDHFNDDEILANEAVIKFPTPKIDFNKIVSITPSDSE